MASAATSGASDSAEQPHLDGATARVVGAEPTEAAASSGSGAAAAAAVPEPELAAWMVAQAQAEVTRIRSINQTCLLVPVKNTALQRGHTDTDATAADTAAKPSSAACVNRIECNTKFDFSKVRQIMVSPKVPCPHKAGFYYVNVICLSGGGGGDGSKQKKKKPVPLLLPYLYDGAVADNDLKEWLFVNSLHQEARHRIDQLQKLA